MDIQLFYQEANRRYPNLVQEIMNKLRKGKSKERNSNPEDLSWSITWSQAIKSMSFMELLQDRTPDAPKVLTEDGVKEFLGDSILWGLQGKIKKWVGRSDTWSKTNIPSEIIQGYLKQFTEQAEDKRRYEELSPEERQKEINGLVRELSKGHGFAAFSIPIDFFRQKKA